MTPNEKILKDTVIDLYCTIRVLNDYINTHLAYPDNNNLIVDLRGAVQVSEDHVAIAEETIDNLPKKGFFARLFNL